ncbi:MAG TPA: VOC family protein [Terriglobales bacterium]|nr:VOC family protein [Terriglobales bacterium]
MPRRSLIDQLDEAVQVMLASPEAPLPKVDARIAPLLRIAADLRDLPRAQFKDRLGAQFGRRKSMATVAEPLYRVQQTAAPVLTFENTADAIDFYTKAFGARETMRFEHGGHIGHAEVVIGNTVIVMHDESPDWGAVSPKVLGGSPVRMQLYVDDVDTFVEHAASAGAKLFSPVQDQFYGARSGMLIDPFGYWWSISTKKEDVSLDEMHRRMDEMMKQEPGQPAGVKPVPEGYHTITPYIIVQNAPGLIDFVTEVFGGELTFRTTGSAGGVHAEVRVGDSMLMIGGGAPELNWRGEAMPTALHTYVKDVDACYQRALKAGATSIDPPRDQEYGERGASVRDQFGNHWYIATAFGETYVPKGLRTVNCYLHPLRAEPLINFLQRAFGAQDVRKYASPDGVIHHARLRIGDSVLEMGEAHEPYPRMRSMFYLYVPDVDRMYRRAVAAGGVSIAEPTDHPYGDRSGGIKDAFGNTWYIATHIKDVEA